MSPWRHGSTGQPSSLNSPFVHRCTSQRAMYTIVQRRVNEGPMFVHKFAQTVAASRPHYSSRISRLGVISLHVFTNLRVLYRIVQPDRCRLSHLHGRRVRTVRQHRIFRVTMCQGAGHIDVPGLRRNTKIFVRGVNGGHLKYISTLGIVIRTTLKTSLLSLTNRSQLRRYPTIVLRRLLRPFRTHHLFKVRGQTNRVRIVLLIFARNFRS